MATKYKERLVKLRSKDCPGVTYFTKRNKKKLANVKLVKRKYCPLPGVRKHVEFKEVK